MTSKLEKMFRGMVYVLPGVLFFSYQPLIHFGASESMNFEISLPLIWLVLFDLLVVVMGFKKRGFWRGILKHWVVIVAVVAFAVGVVVVKFCARVVDGRDIVACVFGGIWFFEF